MNKFVLKIEELFEANRNDENAYFMKKYMKNKFEFLGIKKPLRTELSHDMLKKANLPNKSEFFDIIIELNALEYREYHQFAIEVMIKYAKDFEINDIELLEFMIITNSWWDTVDMVSTKGVGTYFLKFPEMINDITQKWMASEYLWLQRTCIIFQLSYKTKTDTGLLSRFILLKKDDKEFFIRKAIGWALREYSKTNPNWVKNFVNEVGLSGLSKREALRLIK